MTDNEIIKALERMSAEDPNGFSNDVLNLINRQKAEIERYEKENAEQFNKWMRLDERTKERYAELYEEAKGIVKIEAIKEFAERLKESAFDCDVSFGYGKEHYENAVAVVEIDRLVKEMVGDRK